MTPRHLTMPISLAGARATGSARIDRRNPIYQHRGQIMALAAAFILFVCFVLFSTIGIAWKIKERVRLQHASDAGAYSQAVKIARGFNYFAFTNRAIASHLVSLTTLHAYHSEISAAKGLYQNLALAYQLITSEEIALTTCVMGIGPCQFGCFLHAAEDEITAFDLLSKSQDFEEDIEDLDKSFVRAVDGYQSSIRLIQLSQQAVQLELLATGAQNILKQLGATGDMGSSVSLDAAMKPFNFPAGQDASKALDALNLTQLRQAIEFGDDDQTKIEMTEVANSARPLWVRNRLIGGNTVTLSPLMSRLREDTDGQWMTAQIPVVQGASGIYDEKPGALPTPTAVKSQTRGKGIGSVDYWEMTGMCEHNHGGSVLLQPFLGPVDPGIIYSSANDSEHNMHNSDVDHDLDVDELLRFMRFKIDEEDNYRQPVVYKMLKSDLSRDEQGRRMPWDIFSSGKFTGNLLGGRDQSVQLRLTSDSDAYSMSKALVYYHHPGNWREPPNFWNPFWRVKLHPFTKQEVFQIEALAEQSLAAAVFATLDITANDKA